MPFDDYTINSIYEKNDSCCVYCEKKLAFVNYGKRGKKGAWHIDHSVSKANGGTDHLNNLVPACVGCNQDKSHRNGTHYKKKFEPETLGGKLVDLFGLSKGFMGASRRRRLK